MRGPGGLDGASCGTRVVQHLHSDLLVLKQVFVSLESRLVDE